MCELFGLSASEAVRPEHELAEFRLRGGGTADNPDGWGLASWETGAFRLAKEPVPACASALFRELCGTTRSNLIVAHVRKARMPPVNTLENTHPFQHTCCDRAWVFAHNGLVPEVVEMEHANDRSICRPAGETDSEHAFCHLLSHIAQQFSSGRADTTAVAVPALARISELIASHGKFNFLLSDGEYLVAYGHDRLHYRESRASGIGLAMIATEPLTTTSGWIPFEPGELRIYRHGLLAGRALTRPVAQSLSKAHASTV